MDYLTCHLGHLPRRYPSVLPVQNVGHLLKTEADSFHDHPFVTVNFSFILEGAGSYRVDEEPSITVRAPCVLTQAPGHVYSYGPGPGQSWRELFLIYPENKLQILRECRFYDPTVKAWPIDNFAAVQSNAQSLMHALFKRETDGMVDVIDRLSELLILESRRRSPPRDLSALHTRLYALRQEIDLHPEQERDFHSLAGKFGCSYSTFRRDWKILFGQSPRRYTIERRLQEACRLLVESDLSIGEIAARLAFGDPLYFSRRFHQYSGYTASEYRRINESVRRRS